MSLEDLLQASPILPSAWNYVLEKKVIFFAPDYNKGIAFAYYLHKFALRKAE